MKAGHVGDRLAQNGLVIRTNMAFTSTARSLLIIESHGGGEQGYFDPHSHAIDLFEQLCATLPPERIWDLCYLVATTQNQAYRKGRHEMAMLFLQGRLKRKRRNHQYQLEILPETRSSTQNVLTQSSL